ncbi:homeobox KN domain-containing protein [Auriculariales sp. MPI-PUGE-AT-0066]|nr:homeobox KN domain-containing protein [Auriculariales sp. MPI-PUGE-AT-0066]
MPSSRSTSPSPTAHSKMNINYAHPSAPFPSTTDAWMHARPTVSPLKTADDAYRYTTQHGPLHATVPSPPPSLTASTPRTQWLAGSDGGRRTSSYSTAHYTPSGSYAPSPVLTGSPTDDHWSPTASYSPSYLPPSSAPQHHHYQQAPPPPQSYPSAVPLGHQMPNTIPMPIPLGSAQPRRRGKLPKATTEYLKDWLHKHADHPYPTEDEKKRLCAVTGLSMSQVSNWMINARRRILAPARANATNATPYGVPQYTQGPPRPPSGDSSATSRSGDLLYSAAPAQAYPQPQTLPSLPQPGQLGGGISPPHRTNSWPTLPPSHQQPPSPPHMTGHYGYATGPMSQPADGTISRGSPHSSHHSDHILPPVSTLPPVSIHGEQ